MSETVLELTAPALITDPDDIPIIEIDHLITEDDTPVDNILSERQMRLITDPLYASWPGPGDNRPFVAMTNVALYATPHEDPLVPDALISLDVELPTDLMQKAHRSYFLWEYGKPPDVVIEIVSNKKGREAGYKMRQYARLRVWYYVIFDPAYYLSKQLLRVYELHSGQYQLVENHWLNELGLGLTVWYGTYEGARDTWWLRWCDEQGQMLPTKEENMVQANHRAEQERQRAEQERQRAERLAARLRAMGIEEE